MKRPVLESLPIGIRRTIHAFNYAASSFTTPWHFHPEHELTLIEASNGTRFIGDHVGAYAPGELVLLRGNLPHCWKNHQTDAQSRSTVIQWRPGTFTSVPELSSISALLQIGSRGIIFTREDVKDLLPRISALPELPPQGQFQELLSILLQLAECRYETLSDATFHERLPQADGTRMQKIHRFVEGNYQRKIQLKIVAQHIHLSDQAFNRFFRKMMGRSFFHFLNEYRVNRAGQLLLATDWPVSQVAEACGFPSLPFFHRQFKRFLGTTPLRYRKQHLGG